MIDNPRTGVCTQLVMHTLVAHLLVGRSANSKTTLKAIVQYYIRTPSNNVHILAMPFYNWYLLASKLTLDSPVYGRQISTYLTATRASCPL